MKTYGGRKWISGKHYRIPYSQSVKGLFDIFAAKNIHNDKRHYRFYSWKNSFIVIDFIDWLLYQVYPDKELYIILDGWSAHKSNMFFAYADLQPRLHLLPLPTCSSWMNPIERDFSKFDKDILQNSNFQTVREAMNRIANYFEKETSFMTWGT